MIQTLREMEETLLKYISTIRSQVELLQVKMLKVLRIATSTTNNKLHPQSITLPKQEVVLTTSEMTQI